MEFIRNFFCNEWKYNYEYYLEFKWIKVVIIVFFKYYNLEEELII